MVFWPFALCQGVMVMLQNIFDHHHGQHTTAAVSHKNRLKVDHKMSILSCDHDQIMGC